MPEKDREIPKPTIKTTPPVKPPVTSADTAIPEKAPPPEIPKESVEATPRASGDVETDLVKRFLGAFIDGIVAAVIGYVIFEITGSWFLQQIVTGLVFLTRDSLPMLDGQSIGKKVMKTKAVKEDGSSLSGDWVTGATRNILFAFPMVGIIECFIILSRSGKPEGGLRLGDDWAKTKVISVE